MSSIYLVRHGQAAFGAEDYDQLTDIGVRQSQVLGASLATLPIDVVVAGTMRRHQQTAAGCLLGMGKSLPVVADSAWNEFPHEAVLAVGEPRFRDRAFMLATMRQVGAGGSGGSAVDADFYASFTRAMQLWMASVDGRGYPESWEAFRTRVGSAMATLAASLGAGANALVFTSGGPVAVLCQAALEFPNHRYLQVSTSLVNAGVSKFIRGRGGVHLSSLNIHNHFEAAYSDLITYR